MNPIIWKLFLLLVPLVVVIDLIWLGLIMKPFYDAQIGELARRNGAAFAPRWPAAMVVYVLIPAGIVLFVRPAMGNQASLLTALGWGALFGLVLYGVYDCTNRSILEKWPLALTVVDIAWGCCLCGLGAVAMHFIERAWMR